ncbi:MAG: XTP/dITP diphosphatase [Muribaculum sp.]|nr:XTP/dITP diphosphatase [Muribaculum sp.]
MSERQLEEMMFEKIIFATQNAGKMREIRMILADMGREILSLKEAGIAADAEENGESYRENALIKARAAAASPMAAGAVVLADDSGLEVDYLHGEPGVYSARYLGEDTPYAVKNAKLIERLLEAAEEERTARFVCAIAAVLPDGTELTTQAAIEGRIAHAESGSHGFGYDPIFYVPEFGRTTAELSEEEKNQVSHRGKALRLMKEELKRYESTDRQ